MGDARKREARLGVGCRMNWRNGGRLLRRVQEDVNDDNDDDGEEDEDDGDKDDDRDDDERVVLRSTLDFAKLGLLFPRR